MLFLAGIAIGSCNKVTSGYLSAQIRYPDNPIQVARGIVTQTNPCRCRRSPAPRWSINYWISAIQPPGKHAGRDIRQPLSLYLHRRIFDPTIDTTPSTMLRFRPSAHRLPLLRFQHPHGRLHILQYATGQRPRTGTYTYDVKATNESWKQDLYEHRHLLTLYDGLAL